MLAIYISIWLLLPLEAQPSLLREFKWRAYSITFHCLLLVLKLRAFLLLIIILAIIWGVVVAAILLLLKHLADS